MDPKTNFQGETPHKPVQVTGGGLRDSFLVSGVAFKKTFAYAGFEQQPKYFENPKILLLNIELELKVRSRRAAACLRFCSCATR